MRTISRVLRTSACVVALFAEPSASQARIEAKAGVVSAISKLENDAVKADLADDPAYYRRVLAEDWTRGDSDGTFYTKAQILNLMSGANNLKFNREKISDLEVRVYGNTAVATYRSTYDILILGHRRAHTIIATDTFAKIGGEWRQVASHGAETR
ncbi:MAG TPA: nuclear transport factor 2 family protein [Caulobacteraceae bacterium]|jgi:hypothetical protein